MKIYNTTCGELIDIPGDTLQGAYLRNAALRDANLRGADLQGAYLRGADLRYADLQGAYLRGADLQGANLRDAYLRRANLRGADLRSAILQDADLEGADLQGAYLPDGRTLPEFIAWMPDGLLCQGGKTVAEVAASWEYHSWTSCPMATAFGAKHLEDVPSCHRRGAEVFVALFDGGHLPKPEIK